MAKGEVDYGRITYFFKYGRVRAVEIEPWVPAAIIQGMQRSLPTIWPELMTKRLVAPSIAHTRLRSRLTREEDFVLSEVTEGHKGWGGVDIVRVFLAWSPTAQHRPLLYRVQTSFNSREAEQYLHGIERVELSFAAEWAMRVHRMFPAPLRILDVKPRGQANRVA